MVLAGPGTGKTFTIIQRIKYMIEEKAINPISILCLTYSEAAANEMKARIVKEIGSLASGVTVNTYHAFCNEIIKQNPYAFELLDGVNLVDDITKSAFMKEVIDELKPVFYKTKWGDSYYYIPELIDAVDEIKSNRISKDEYFNTLNTHPQWQGKLNDLIAEYKQREEKGKLVATFLKSFEDHKRKMGKAKEAWDIYEAYDIKLKKNNLIDFNDMISMVLDVFDYNNELLNQVASQYEYFLVDEYQDTNYSQNSIVFKLAEGAKSNNIFVVGDDDQIIYEFQGAKTDTLEKFLLRFPDTHVICLNENNRSTQNILDFSYKVISQDKSRLENNPKFKSYNISKRLLAKNPDIIPLNKKIQIHTFADLKQENNFIVSQIENIINSDDCPKTVGEKDLSKIAVLTRDNIELTTFAKLLEAKNIQYQVKSNKSIFEIRSSILVYFYLQTLENYKMYSDKLFALLLSEPFKFDLEDYNYLIEQNRLNHNDLITNIYEKIKSHTWKNKQSIKKFIDTFEYLNKIKANENIKNLIIETVNRTGILEYFLDCEVNRTENIYAIKKIIDEAQGLLSRNPSVSLKDFLEHIDNSFSSNIPILIDKEEYTQNAIQLLTIHSSKGREFDYVFIPNLISKKWESKRISKTMSLPIEKDTIGVDIEQAKTSEQLRLLFVGITRAKHSLFLSCSNSIDGSPQELTKYISQAINADDDIVQTINHELTKDNILEEIAASISKCEYDYKTAFVSEINARTKEFILSPSSMTSYLNCPRSFLYSEILKIPVYDANSDSASYGSAIHKTLENAVKRAKEAGLYPDKAEIFEDFKHNLGKQKFDSQKKRDELTARGIKSLESFYKNFIQVPSSRIYATEFYLNHVPFENKFLKGFVDRIEKNSDGTYELYDYKTGSAKSKSKISDGGEYEHYLNQLRFYKFAFESLYKGAKVTRAGIIFAEESDKSYYITLADEDNEIIKNKIKFVYDNIDAMNFDAAEKCDEKCKYCAYKEFCNLNLF